MGNNSVHGSLKRRRKKSIEEITDDPFKSEENAPQTILDFYDKRDEDALSDKLIEFEAEESEIQAFYKGKNVLMTGASGFVGTILLEKLLRTTDINKIYILFRGKKSQSLDDRLRDFFADDAFDRLRKENVNFTERIVVLTADLQSDGLGLDEKEKKVLREDINIVFHVAATVKFDEHFQTAFEINCKGTEKLLKMAEEMKNLDSFIYVSTAYSNCNIKKIEEKFYEPLYTHIEMEQIINSCSHTELTVLNDILIKPMPNTYTLSKNACEQMVREKMDKLPLGIVRPSIVMPVVEEPCPMWVKGMNGLTAMYVAVGLGIMRTVYQNTSNIVDMVPGDLVVNILLAAAWDVARRVKKLDTITRSDQNVEAKLIDPNNNVEEESIKKLDINYEINHGNYDTTNHVNYIKQNIKEKFIDKYNNNVPDTDDSFKISTQTQNLADSVISNQSVSNKSNGEHSDRIYHMVEIYCIHIEKKTTIQGCFSV
ncbi:hypothetical protein M8J75_003835 [Diaphorina citri]|nr:hypothetical protein M8J75_003835 [Diaphorina citri]